MRPTTIISLVIFLGLCAWVISLSPRTTRRVQSAALTVASPFIKSGSAMEERVNAFREEVRRGEELEAENERLRRELRLLRLYSSDRREVYEENKRLAESLDYKRRSPFELLPARVVMRDRATWWSTLVIDRGYEDKLAPGSAVIAPEGLVGRVLTVAPATSIVLLLTDENCKVAARTMGSRAVRGVIRGARGNTGSDVLLRMEPLPLDTRLEGGKQVFSTGAGGVFPPNFPVGTVERVVQRDFYSEALVRPAVDFLRLDQVFVVLSDGGEASS